eukprot:3430419-Amphidinium_carterae.1
MLGAENYSQRCFQHPAGCPEAAWMMVAILRAAILDDICARLRLPASALHVKDYLFHRLHVSASCARAKRVCFDRQWQLQYPVG